MTFPQKGICTNYIEFELNIVGQFYIFSQSVNMYRFLELTFILLAYQNLFRLTKYVKMHIYDATHLSLYTVNKDLK